MALDFDSFESESEFSDSNSSELGIDQYTGGQNRVSSNSEETDWKDLSLMEVAKLGDAYGLKRVLQERDPSILHQGTPLANTLLHLAAKFQFINLLLEICERCPSLVSERNQCGNTPLHVGARAGNLAVVHHLIDKMTSSSSSDANIEYGTTRAVCLLGLKNHKGDTALHEALRYCRRDVAKLLIEKDSDLCQLVNNADESPLFLAVIKGYSDVVDQILCSSPSPACGGPKGWTALHASSVVNNEIVGSYMTEKLLQLKPELARVKDLGGWTPLHHAVSVKNASIVRLLLQHDSSVVYIQDTIGWSPLHAAAANGSDLQFLKMTNIIQYCPDLEYLVDIRGNNVLHILMTRMDTLPFTSKLFRKFDLEELLNQPNNDGNTPLHLATIGRKEHFVRFLAKDSRVDKKARNNYNMTAYGIACREYDKSLREKDKNRRRAWKQIKSNLDPHDQYFLGDKLPLWRDTLEVDVERVAQEDAEKDVKNQEVHEKDAKLPLWRETLELDVERIAQEDAEKDLKNQEVRQNDGKKKVVRPKEARSQEDLEDLGVDVVMAMVIALVAFVSALQMPVRPSESGVEAAAFAAFVISDAVALSCSILTLILPFVASSFDDYDPSKIRTITTIKFLFRFAILAIMVASVCGMLVVLIRTRSLWVGIATLFVCLCFLPCFFPGLVAFSQERGITQSCGSGRMFMGALRDEGKMELMFCYFV